MTYPRYYVCLLNFVNGRNLHEESPPDSIADTELKLMEESAAKAGLWKPAEMMNLKTYLDSPLKHLCELLAGSHAKYDPLRIHGISLHPKETLWLEALDKALPLFSLAVTHEWAKEGAWKPSDFSPARAKDNSEDETIVHRLLIAMFQYALRELDRE